MIFIFPIILGLQCPVNFHCTAKGPSHTYLYSFSRIIFLMVPSTLHSFSNVTGTPNASWWHSSFCHLGKSRLEHDSPKRIQGYGNRDLILSYFPSSMEMALGWVLLNSVSKNSTFFFFLVFLGLHLWDMEVPRLGVKSELHRQAIATATAISQPHLQPLPQLTTTPNP